jgi:hypothetical protein
VQVPGVLLQAALVAPLGHDDGMICTLGTHQTVTEAESAEQGCFGRARPRVLASAA